MRKAYLLAAVLVAVALYYWMTQVGDHPGAYPNKYPQASDHWESYSSDRPRKPDLGNDPVFGGHIEGRSEDPLYRSVCPLGPTPIVSMSRGEARDMMIDDILRQNPGWDRSKFQNPPFGYNDQQICALWAFTPEAKRRFGSPLHRNLD